MGLFRRGDTPGRERSGLGGADGSRLYQHGIDCVTRQDGKGMMAAGWGLLDISGIHERQAFDFLSDGFRAWRSEPDYDSAARHRRADCDPLFRSLLGGHGSGCPHARGGAGAAVRSGREVACAIRPAALGGVGSQRRLGPRHRRAVG
jgi:hypothetical protein